MEDVVIIPCPFCGSTKLKVDSKHHGKHYYEGSHSATVRCQKCHARGPTAACKVTREQMHVTEATKQKAIELWNARASMA
jgi:Lar family restriction alleviation protein